MFIHKPHCLCVYRACICAVSAKYVLRYAALTDSIVAMRVTELVWRLAQEFGKYSHTGFAASQFPCDVGLVFSRMNVPIAIGSLSNSLLHISGAASGGPN